MAAATSPAYQRKFTRAQNFSAAYFTSAIVKPDTEREIGKAELPRTLRWRQAQLGRAMSAASQMNRRAAELEKFVKRRLKQATAEHERLTGQKAASYPLIMAMQPDEYQRWCYVREAARRADETAARLEAALFERLAQLRKGDDQADLVAAMAAASEPDETVAPEPDSSTESED
jgi:hypothetical protein